MEQYKIDRINELYKKYKSEGLTETEAAERKALQKEYVAAFRNNLISQLDNTYVVDEAGNKRKL